MNPLTDNPLVDILVSVSPERWIDRAACKDADPNLFFPKSTESADEAIEICNRCPVRENCEQYALKNRERYGVWAGRRHGEMSEPSVATKGKRTRIMRARKLFRAGKTRDEIGEILGVRRSTVYDYLRGEKRNATQREN